MQSSIKKKKKKNLDKYLLNGIQMNHSLIHSITRCPLPKVLILPQGPGLWGVFLPQQHTPEPRSLGSGVCFCLNNKPSLPALRMFCCPSLPLQLLTILFSTFLLSLLGFMSLRTLPNVCPTGTPDTLHGPPYPSCSLSHQLLCLCE